MPSSLLASAAAALSAAALASAAPAGPSCCAFGASGASTLMGLGSFVFPDSDNAQVASFLPIAVGTTGEAAENPWVGVLINPGPGGPEDSFAGWIIAPNATSKGQNLIAWINLPNSKPSCFRAFTEAGDSFTPGFGLCAGAGAASALFPFPNATYNLAGAGPITTFDQEVDGIFQARISILNAGQGGSCTPLSLAAAGNPIGTGAFSVSFEEGVPQAPAWGLPTWC